MRTCVKSKLGAGRVPARNAGPGAPVVDVLVDNGGWSCYGNGMKVPITGIDRWVQANGQDLPRWAQWHNGTMAQWQTSSGHLADTYLNFKEWGKAWRTSTTTRSQATTESARSSLTTAPAVFLRQGSNELVL